MNHESAWAREGDIARKYWQEDMWSPFSSLIPDKSRSEWRMLTHGFDFRVESERGTKRMIRI